MDDFKILIWIVLGLIYLFARKKKQPTPPAPARRVETAEEDSTSPKPMTFEDLLREIEGSKKPPIQEPVYEAPKPEWKPYKYEEEVVVQQPLEDADYDYRKHDTIYEDYDNAKKYAFVKPSLEETMKVEDTVVRFNQFKPYEQESRQKFRKDLLDELKNPQSFKNSFIMSEILKRKF